MEKVGDMKENIKAALLSAFVLPGVGQFYRGRFLKGGVLIILMTILLIVAFILVACVVQGVVHAPPLPSQVPVDPFAALLGKLKPMLKWLGGAFLCIWIYGVADALLGKGTEENGGSVQ